MKKIVLCTVILSVMGYASETLSVMRYAFGPALEPSVSVVAPNFMLESGARVTGTAGAQSPNTGGSTNPYHTKDLEVSLLPELFGLVTQIEDSVSVFVGLYSCKKNINDWVILEQDDFLLKHFEKIQHLDKNLMHRASDLGRWRILTHSIPGHVDLKVDMLLNRATYMHKQMEGLSAAVERIPREKAERRARRALSSELTGDSPGVVSAVTSHLPPVRPSSRCTLRAPLVRQNVQKQDGK